MKVIIPLDKVSNSVLFYLLFICTREYNPKQITFHYRATLVMDIRQKDSQRRHYTFSSFFLLYNTHFVHYHVQSVR